LFAGEQPQQFRRRSAWVTPEGVAQAAWVLGMESSSFMSTGEIALSAISLSPGGAAVCGRRERAAQ